MGSSPPPGSLAITDDDIPSLEGEVAIITGGGSGIGLAAVRLLAGKGAQVFVLDLNEPNAQTIPLAPAGETPLPDKATFVRCDVSSWQDLRSAFETAVSQAGRIDIAIANAGVSEEYDYFADQFDDSGDLLEPGHAVVDVNFRGVVNFVKLAVHHMRKQQNPAIAGRPRGRIVITASATAYAPEQNLPVYSASKLAASLFFLFFLYFFQKGTQQTNTQSLIQTIALVRGLRSTLITQDITINAVAPAATITKLLPQNLAAPLMAAGLPVSSAEFVGRALVFSATAQQKRRVEDYGKETSGSGLGDKGPWNGRTILTLGDQYTELEEEYAQLRRAWFGEENSTLTRKQQAATDFRQLG
ncbi:hypothetical protein V8F33_010364 [Rhypophila sp. PSN 637]